MKHNCEEQCAPWPMQTIPEHVFMWFCSDRIKISQETDLQSLLLAETSAGRYSAAAEPISPCFFPLIFQTVKLASWHKLLQCSLGAKICPGLHL